MSSVREKRKSQNEAKVNHGDHITEKRDKKETNNNYSESIQRYGKLRSFKSSKISRYA